MSLTIKIPKKNNSNQVSAIQHVLFIHSPHTSRAQIPQTHVASPLDGG
jgi:hypothetical protein